jgi:membrane protein YqaA with SNARE-associated domain
MDFTPDLDPSDHIGAFLFCFFAGLSFFVNAEATVVVTATQFELHPVLGGLGASLGQAVLYWLLYRFGDVLSRRWKWLNRQVTRTREKYGTSLQDKFTLFSAMAGFLGIPPATAMAVIAPGLGYRLRNYLIIAVPLRFVRFVILGAFSQELAALWTSIFE